MKDLGIKVEDLSKMYDLGQVGTGTLAKDLNRTFAKLQGKPDPYATLAEINDRTQTSKTGTVWALKDINFEVERGEVLGIIGRNGAGKSTLLKILSQITAPTTGVIKTKGRLASLLEVGTGMHPEMSARENIFLNGAIMGMTRPEIKKKLDDIVDFAGIAKYIDTPIKRFSSGMQVRLGFAVAAFLEPEILIVDEVLAVGDAEFQKRAIGKMKEVSKGGDRTVLFVSHNMDSVNKLCSRAILLKNGTINYSGKVNDVINQYLTSNENSESTKIIETRLNDDIQLRKATLLNNKKLETNVFEVNETWYLNIDFEVMSQISNYIFALGLITPNGVSLNTSWSHPITLEKGSYSFSFEVENLPLQSGHYNLVLGISLGMNNIYFNDSFLTIQIENITMDNRIMRADGSTGILAKVFETKITKNENF